MISILATITSVPPNSHRAHRFMPESHCSFHGHWRYSLLVYSVAVSIDYCGILKSSARGLAGWSPPGGRRWESRCGEFEFGALTHPPGSCRAALHNKGTLTALSIFPEHKPRACQVERKCCLILFHLYLFINNIFLCGSHVTCFSSMGYLLPILD